MALVGAKVRMIISDPWERFRDIKAVVQSSFIYESRQYSLILEDARTERYLVTPRYLEIDLEVIFLGRVAPVGIFEVGKYSDTFTNTELIHNSHYIGIGSIELVTDT
jgi:hypothetical protein